MLGRMVCVFESRLLSVLEPRILSVLNTWILSVLESGTHRDALGRLPDGGGLGLVQGLRLKA